ncbi:MAG TPA: hypothetical protein VK524_05765 [Polyangiaceae bacterium]|nr:hypothetical protein [Polyangiaceae bacterium]
MDFSHAEHFATHFDDASRDAWQKPEEVLRLLAVDFTRESDIGPPLQHRLTAEEVMAEMQAGGLTAALLRETLPKQYVVSGTRPR